MLTLISMERLIFLMNECQEVVRQSKCKMYIPRRIKHQFLIHLTDFQFIIRPLLIFIIATMMKSSSPASTSSCGLYSPNIGLETCYENAPHLDHWGAIKTIIQMEHAFNPSKLKLLPYFEHSQLKHTYINPKYTLRVGNFWFA